ncbi:MAG: hypothetical protein IKU84_03645 [Clostridia bacterium]|nr:hypothetical protein [Clostridia bacterium]
MRNFKRFLILPLLILVLCGCSKGNMKDLYNANTLTKVFKTHSSVTLTTTMSDGKTFSRYYEPNFACFYDDAKRTVYLSSGCYSYSDGKFYTEIYLREDYSFHMLKERFTAPLVAEGAKVSTVLGVDEGLETITVRTKPTDSYARQLYEEYGIESGKFEVNYIVTAEGKEYVGQEILLDGTTFATITSQYDLPRPELADELYARLTAPANQCRTIKVILDPNESNQRTVVARTQKGDSFKLDPPSGYKSAFANAKCTAPYKSKGADVDAVIYLKYGK